MDSGRGMKIADGWIDELKQRVDLEELATRYGVRSVRSGPLPTAHCPFHKEDTHSFRALQEPRVGSSRFECCGSCGKFWDGIAFVQGRAGLGFMEAVNELAAVVGMAIPKANEPNEERPARKSTNAGPKRFSRLSRQPKRTSRRPSRPTIRRRHEPAPTWLSGTWRRQQALGASAAGRAPGD
jgi:DNA primase